MSCTQIYQIVTIVQANKNRFPAGTGQRLVIHQH